MGKISKFGQFKLEYSEDGGSTKTLVPGVKSFDPGEITTEQVDVTDFDSTGSFREYANGYKEASEGSITLNYDEEDSVHQALEAAVGGAALQFIATYGNQELILDALITGFSTPTQIGQVQEANVTIKMTGEPTRQAAV